MLFVYVTPKSLNIFYFVFQIFYIYMYHNIISLINVLSNPSDKYVIHENNGHYEMYYLYCIISHLYQHEN